jgi:hypothetical protein
MKDLLLTVCLKTLVSPVRLRDPLFLLESGGQAVSAAVRCDLSNRRFERSLCKDEACHALGRQRQRNQA